MDGVYAPNVLHIVESGIHLDDYSLAEDQPSVGRDYDSLQLVVGVKQLFDEDGFREADV